MPNITREFWCGNILPQNDCRPQNAQTKEFAELIIKNRNDLLLNRVHRFLRFRYHIPTHLSIENKNFFALPQKPLNKCQITI